MYSGLQPSTTLEPWQSVQDAGIDSGGRNPRFTLEHADQGRGLDQDRADGLSGVELVQGVVDVALEAAGTERWLRTGGRIAGRRWPS